MAEKNKKSNTFDEKEVDPFDELNVFDEDFTSIETEKDFFDEIEQSDLETVPEYDSTSGKIIEGSDPVSQANSNLNRLGNDKNSLMETIDEVDVNNVKNSVESNDTKKTNKNGKKLDFVSKLKLSKSKTSKKSKPAKPTIKKPAYKSKVQKTIDEDTKIIDNVKVDSDGVPLLNQFDTEKIKESTFFPKIKISKISISRIIMIVLGLIVSIIGIIQAMNDVVKVSDHVMYGEHGSFAYGLIFLGIIIIILAFYKELMKMVGLNNLSNVMDEVEDSVSDKKHKKNK
ncbi:MAG: hypothetical protein E7Z85_03250 [Methanosphaera stadtmanae]|nr:hypothetical protein [Methanosphaera stadtmanae]